jgi:Tfp pilus assembly protein PilO
MAGALKSDYQLNYARYKHYYRQIWKFYQKPIAKVSTALLLTIFTTVFFAVFAIKPTLVTVAELLKTIKDQEIVLEKLKNKAAALATAQSEFAAQAPRIDRLKEALPEDKNVQQISLMMEATGADHQLAYDTFTVAEFEYDPDKSYQDIETLPVSLSLAAGYPSLKPFLTDILRLPRFITAESIAFNEPSDITKLPTTSDISPIQLNVKVNTFFMPVTPKGKP